MGNEKTLVAEDVDVVAGVDEEYRQVVGVAYCAFFLGAHKKLQRVFGS